MKMVFPEVDVHVGLVHWPILDGAGSTVVTNVTNFDIHDIARASCTYGVKNYFIINRLQEQLMYVDRVLDHWRVGEGSVMNPKRKTALGVVKTAETIEQAVAQISPKPLVVATAARDINLIKPIAFKELRQQIFKKGEERPILLIFGTGFGLHEDALKQCDVLLEPITGASRDDYRHLSVRSAVSICLDRLLGTW